MLPLGECKTSWNCFTTGHSFILSFPWKQSWENCARGAADFTHCTFIPSATHRLSRLGSGCSLDATGLFNLFILLLSLSTAALQVTHIEMKEKALWQRVTYWLCWVPGSSQECHREPTTCYSGAVCDVLTLNLQCKGFHWRCLVNVTLILKIMR